MFNLPTLYYLYFIIATCLASTILVIIFDKTNLKKFKKLVHSISAVLIIVFISMTIVSAITQTNQQKIIDKKNRVVNVNKANALQKKITKMQLDYQFYSIKANQAKSDKNIKSNLSHANDINKKLSTLKSQLKNYQNKISKINKDGSPADNNSSSSAS